MKGGPLTPFGLAHGIAAVLVVLVMLMSGCFTPVQEPEEEGQYWQDLKGFRGILTNHPGLQVHRVKDTKDIQDLSDPTKTCLLIMGTYSFSLADESRMLRVLFSRKCRLSMREEAPSPYI